MTETVRGYCCSCCHWCTIHLLSLFDLPWEAYLDLGSYSVSSAAIQQGVLKPSISAIWTATTNFPSTEIAGNSGCGFAKCVRINNVKFDFLLNLRGSATNLSWFGTEYSDSTGGWLHALVTRVSHGSFLEKMVAVPCSNTTHMYPYDIPLVLATLCCGCLLEYVAPSCTTMVA